MGPNLLPLPTPGAARARDPILERATGGTTPNAKPATPAAGAAGAATQPQPGGQREVFDIFSAAAAEEEDGEGGPPQLASVPPDPTVDLTRPAQPRFAARDEERRDEEGFFIVQVGEQLQNGRYLVKQRLGQGSFGTVLKAADLTQRVVLAERRQVVDVDVAVKVTRKDHRTEEAARKEVAILRHLQQQQQAESAGPQGVVRLIDTFAHCGHFCVVLELLDISLRDALKRFGTAEGRVVGLHLDAVVVYTRDLLLGLQHLRRCGVVHGDIKPDNVMLNAKYTAVKLVDFGTAQFAGSLEISPYFASRWYRAPEVILGFPSADCPLDLWSAACTLYEAFTGKALFPGRTNNDQLRLIIDLLGRFPNRLLKTAHAKGQPHFDADGSFLELREDAVTGRLVGVKRAEQPQAARARQELRRRMESACADAQGNDAERTRAQGLADLLEQCLQLDPVARPTPESLLQLPLFAHLMAANKPTTQQSL